MSEIKFNSVPIPIRYNVSKAIPIKKSEGIFYTKSWHSFSNPNSQIQKYLFELIVVLNNGDKKTFRNLENNKHSSLISTKDQIKLDTIVSYELVVTKIPSQFINYNLIGSIDHNKTSHYQNDENLYIEFSQNSLGFVNCNCSFLGVDMTSYCVSPP